MTEPSGPEPSSAPRTSRARAILIAALGFSATGVLVGGLWAWIAPPIHVVVAITRAGERVHDYLGTESEHFFNAPCLMLGLLTVVAVVAPVLAWQWREHRGPRMVVGLSIGMVVVAVAAAAVGALLVLLRYGALNFDAVPLFGKPAVAYVIQAPPVFFGQGPLQAVAYPVVACGHRRPGIRGARGRERTRRPGGPSGRRSAVSPRCRWSRKPPSHSGRRRIFRPVMTLAAILTSRAMPT